MAKKERKLKKVIEGNVVKIREITAGTDLEFDFDALPDEIKGKLGPFGLSHKVGDSVAGIVGVEAVETMKKTFESLMSGEWNVKGTRGPSVSMAAINTGIDKLPEGERIAARQLMLKLNIIKPEVQEDIDYLASIGIVAALPEVPEPENDESEGTETEE